VDVHVAQPILAASLSSILKDAMQDYKPEGAVTAPYSDANDLLSVQPKSGGLTDKTSDFTVQVSQAVPAGDVTAVLAAAKQRLENEPAFEEKTTFDASVAGDTQRSALIAIGL